ncbi:MAG: chemotaxis protein CheW [Methanospirillum sp.]|uniref:chemotaxis protein CheW n=1 Tax=Methanospirillum sp. TaxID=45200 RepID=UPI0023754577|nr:chemotaxis protein CheW [Methanospirillum sp.]MDD1728501.1 chemotaxis protein CheW [Methanospirillum sp.]
MGEAVPASRPTTRVAYQGADEVVQVVVFLLNKEKFAINLFDVKEIVEYTKITPVPGSDRYIKGIIDLRGEITTIIDLKEKMRITSGSTQHNQSRIIVIDNSVTKSKTGILVDDVTTVLSTTQSQIDYDTCGGSHSSHILGIIRQKQGDQDSEKADLIIWIDFVGMLQDMDL